MFPQPLRGAFLIFPREPAGAVRCELNVVRRIGVDKIRRLDRDLFYVNVRELPFLERARVIGKV
jgi:hypothetical protein